MRFTVVDPRGRVSFVAPCSTLEALVAACASTNQPRTLEQIGKRLEITRERVRQIEVEALHRLATLHEMAGAAL